MSKKFNLIILFFFCYLISNSQENYLDIIANKSCECIKEKKATKPNLSSSELGICLLTSAKDYQKDIFKDHNLDINSLDGESGEKLGQLIGLRMAFVCPDLLSEFADDDEVQENYTQTGYITKINNDPVVIFELKNDSGKIEKFYWLTFIETSFDLQNSFKELLEKNVQIDYVQQELFDPRIKEYRFFNIITSLNVL
jgi:hypothetical protein